MDEPGKPESLAELLAQWRGAGRDVKAAEDASVVARQALDAARAAEQAATETEAAASAATESMERSLKAAESAKQTASEAAQAARIFLATAEDDNALAELEVQRAGEREAESGRRFHEAQDRKFREDRDRQS